MNSEVLIAGGGAIGLSIARELHKKGIRRITIVERGSVGMESSHAAAGMLAPNAETDEIDDFYRFCSESSRLYPDLADELFEETGIDIELDRSGTLYLALNDTDAAEIQHRFEWQRSAGLHVEKLTGNEIRVIEPFVSPGVREGLLFPDDWQVENRKMLVALKRSCDLNGIVIRENVEIKKLLSENGKITGAEAGDERFHADTVILATGAWTSFIKIDETPVPVRVKPIRGQMICFKSLDRQFSKVIYTPRGYLVPRADGRILAGATVEDAGFEKEVTESGIEQLLTSAFEIAPGLANLDVVEKWAGLRPFAPDGLPILGAIAGKENLFVATGHYRNGILLAPLTAKMIAEKIAENRGSEYFSVFGPDRFRTVSSGV